jgi:hypothetical protein
MLKTQCCLLLFLQVYIFSFAQTKPDSNFHLYLLAGQSNMAGRGEITGKYKDKGNVNVYMLSKNNEWVQAKHPLHFDKPQVVGVGPGLAFAIKMAAQKPGIKVGVIPCAVGGSSIDVWKPGAYDSATKTHPYDDAMKRIAIAMQYGVIKGILWHQGESNSTPAGAADYLPKLKTLVEQLRDSIHNIYLPFVAGELGTYKDQYDIINKVLAMLPKEVPITAVASSKGLKHKGDETHFDSPSAEKLGLRYAKEMKRLQRRSKSS